jgi:hypothetical protein
MSQAKQTESKQHADPTDNDEFGSAGKETGIKQPGETGSAGLYATPVHKEGEEALEEGRRKDQGTTAH